MDEKSKQNIKSAILHSVCALILIFSLLFSVFEFGAVFNRTVQSLKDIWTSLLYYAHKLQGKGMIHATVNDIPVNAIEVLPFDSILFKYKMKAFWALLFSKANLQAFFNQTLRMIVIVSFFAIPVAIALVLLYVLMKLIIKQRKNKRNRDTIFLRVYKIIELYTWEKIKVGIRSYIDFLKKHKIYIIFFIAIWAYNLNFLTIAFEAIAFVVYLLASRDFISIYIQIAKLAMDLTVSIYFVPWYLWAFGGWLLFNAIRRRIGYKRLWKKEKHNEAFLENHPGTLFIVGKQRAGKTTTITDMARSQERIYREQALKGLLKREKQFPFFAWSNVDHLYKIGQTEHKLPLLAKQSDLIKKLRLHHKYRHRYEGEQGKFMRDFLRWRYKEAYGYDYDNFIFDYDFKRYGMEYNNGLQMVNVFEAVEGYINQLYIYAAGTPLIFGNYSIRSDIKWKKNKLFPKMDADYFKRKPQELSTSSQYCHIADQDALRLGKLVAKNSRYKDSLEFGIINMTEYAKERGNQITNRSVSAEDPEANVKNDLLEMNTKLQTQAATVDNYTFIRHFIDDHRPGALGAENRDMCDVAHIKKREKTKCLLPFSGIESALGWIAGKCYDKNRLDEKYSRSDNTLTMYLMRKIFSPIFHYVDRMQNAYGCYRIKLKVTDGADDELLQGDSYYITSMKTLSGAFATDTWKALYHKKALRSRFGLNDVPQYKTVRADDKELGQVHSLLFKRLNDVFIGNRAA